MGWLLEISCTLFCYTRLQVILTCSFPIFIGRLRIIQVTDSEHPGCVNEPWYVIYWPVTGSNISTGIPVIGVFWPERYKVQDVLLVLSVVRTFRLMFGSWT